MFMRLYNDRGQVRDQKILEQRKKTKAQTMSLRRKLYQLGMINGLMEESS
jgi:hypothetical protein